MNPEDNSNKKKSKYKVDNLNTINLFNQDNDRIAADVRRHQELVTENVENENPIDNKRSSQNKPSSN